MADLGSSLQALLQVPGLQQLLNQSITEQQQSLPLRTAIRQQALNMLPNGAFPQTAAGRPNLSAMPPANYSTPPPGTDWTKILGILAAGIGGGGALAKAFGGGNGSSGNIASIVDGLKKLFGHGGQGPNADGSSSRDVFGSNLPGYQDPFGLNGGFNGGSVPGLNSGGIQDPSGGTGIGPGMQQFYGNQPNGDAGSSDTGDWYNDPLYGGGGA